MKKGLFILTTIITLISCGSKDKNNDALAEKKAALDKLIQLKAKTEAEIKTLQDEISKLGGGEINAANLTLVAVTPVAAAPFNHFIDLRGRVDAEDISYVTPRGMGGQVKEIFVKEGDQVRKGQVLLRLDDAIMRQSYNAAKKQLETIRTQLSFSKDIYDRQNNLWKKGIGSEVQLLTAKTNMESLQNQLNAAEEQVKVAAEQLQTSSVTSDVDGTVETMMVRRGELFAGMGQIKIVNTSRLKVVSNVPENYINRVKKGTMVEVEIPETKQTFKTTIQFVGQTIENTQRGFLIEAGIPANQQLKPNQTVVLKIQDYASDRSVTIPINTLQSDESNKYVYVMEKQANGKSIATRKIITLGESYGDQVEVLNGLTGGEMLITAGYQNLYEGQQIRVNP
jgi:membrane fusion protein (multidrug efflux system)